MKIHLRYDGRSRTLDTPVAADSSSEQILRYLQQQGYLPYPKGMTDVMIDRHPDGVVVRPPAIFG